MADFRAIWAACEAVIHLLENKYSDYKVEYFQNTSLEFKVYIAKNFPHRMNAGVSLFLYRVFFSNCHRTPSGRYRSDSQRYYTQLPVDLHFILTAWGDDSTMQHRILGLMMRILEDTPSIYKKDVGDFGDDFEQVFGNDSIDISLAELTTEDMLRLWEVTAQNEYQLSVPYIARNIWIDSNSFRAQGQPIQERTFDTYS